MSKTRGRLALGFFALLILAPAASADNGLATRIEQVIQGPDYRQARWGILVVDAETGRTIYERNADQLFIPASTTKLFSCAAAMGALGADYKFETPVYQRGVVTDGRLHGDLILVAQGDLTLGGRSDAHGRMAFKNHDHIYANFLPGAELTDTDPLAGLNELARQVARQGIRRVEGEVLIDDRLFPKNRGSGSGPSLLTPVVVNDNVVDFRVTPASEAGLPASVEVRPKSRVLQIDARIETVAKGEKPKVQVRSGGSHRYAIRGSIPLGSKPLVTIYPVEDPTDLARALFIDALEREGITVDASPLLAPPAELPETAGYEKLKRVAVYTSPPLSELIKVTLKVSHNLYASTLPILVAVRQGRGTLAEGLHLQRKFLAELGVPVEAISFAGGAGGANADAVTPRAAVALLQALKKRPDYPAFVESLPVLGVDGTLADAVPADSPARGKVRAKTGTLLWHDVMNDRTLLTSKSMAGTLTTAHGRELTFALFVNGVPLPKGVTSTREGKVLGHLCELIVQHGP